MKRKVTPEVEKKIVELRERRYSYEDIARETGLNVKTIRRHIGGTAKARKESQLTKLMKDWDETTRKMRQKYYV